MKKIKRFLAGLAALVVCSCSTETALQRLLGTDAATPVFYGCKTPAEGEVEFFFSSAVKVVSAYFDPPMETELRGEGETVAFGFQSSLPGGSKISADILVEDEDKNTLNVLVSFRTRNNRMPQLVINEIRAAYSKPKVEFIELRTQSPGNLGALRLFAAYDKEDAIFEFPPVEVKAGEYIVVHTRSIETGLVDETGTGLNESKGTDASSGRDFWMPGALKIHSANAIYVMDQDDRIIDGVLLSNGDYKWKDPVAAAAALLVRQGAWNGAGPDDSFNSDGTTVTRTICRTGTDTNTAADWYITVTSGATPGRTNNAGRYK
ncbi:MAG: lamin tail domain-containing protein [Treponema sp.]|jgi:hypothetical protein|nr:lamin tail domain-containing protein [Treponema sp.]